MQYNFTIRVRLASYLVALGIAAAGLPGGAGAAPAQSSRRGAADMELSLGLEIARTPAGGVAGHGLVIAGNRMYLLGGYRVEAGAAAGSGPAATAQVWSAPIGGSGAPGEWVVETPLPSPRARIQGACVAAAGGRLLLIAGGHAGPAILLPPPTTQSGPATADGVRPEPIPMAPSGGPTGPDGAPSITSSGVPSGSTFSETVLLGRRDDAGVLHWRQSAPFPGGARSDVALLVDGNDVYVIGGRQPDGGATAQVLRATLNDKLELGAWQEETPLPEPRIGASAGHFEPRHLGVAGGRGSWKSPPRNDFWLASLPPLATADAPASSTAGTTPPPRKPLAWEPAAITPLYAFAEARALEFNSTWYLLRAPENDTQKIVPGRPGALATGRIHDGAARAWRTETIGLRGFALQAMAADAEGGRIYRVGGLDNTTSQGLSNAVGVFALSGSQVIVAPQKTRVLPPTDEKTRMLTSSERYLPPKRFLAEAEAIEQAKRRQRPMLILVWNSGEPESAKLRQELDKMKGFYGAMTGVVLGEVDAAKDPTAAARLGAASLPCWVLYDKEGKVVERDTQSRTLQQLTELTFKVR